MEKNAQKLNQLKDVLKGKKTLLVVMQNYPDPDALASAAALREIARNTDGIQCTVTSGGIVGRAENRTLAKYLHLPYHTIDKLDIEKYDLIALVDTQPSTGNNDLPDTVTPDIVIDHHPIKRATRSVPFTDVRSRYGACSTILFEYLKMAGIEIEMKIATALLYGIRSDTQDLGRESSKEDIEAYLELYPQVNKKVLRDIQVARTPRSYFRMLEAALSNAWVYGRAIVSNIGQIDIPDIIGEIADLTLRDEDATWTLCYGFYNGQILLSIRTAETDGNAGKVMSRIVKDKGTGGGHHTMAGGQIPCKDLNAKEKKELEELILKRFLGALNITNFDKARLVKSESKTEKEQKA
ncbi:MAG: phosphoesterase [candidate division Zixibacteria bacterium]|nr:phosphoesterase [candidate division Zixibacteria bacterium]